MSDTFIIFERPVGSKTWTLAHRDTGVCLFTDRASAQAFIAAASPDRPSRTLANGLKTKMAYHIHEVGGLPE